MQVFLLHILMINYCTTKRAGRFKEVLNYILRISKPKEESVVCRQRRKEDERLCRPLLDTMRSPVKMYHQLNKYLSIWEIYTIVTTILHNLQLTVIKYLQS